MIEIRPLCPKDINKAAEIVGCHNSDLAHMVRRDLNAHFNNTFFPGSYFIGAVRNDERDELLGLIGLYDDPDPDVEHICWIVWAFVHPRFHRQGIFKALHNSIIDEALKRGTRKIYLDVGNEEDHADALRVYEKFGYAREGKFEDYFKEGEHKIILSLRLWKKA